MFNIGDFVEVLSNDEVVGKGEIVDFHKGFRFPYQLRLDSLALEDYYSETELRLVDEFKEEEYV